MTTVTVSTGTGRMSEAQLERLRQDVTVQAASLAADLTSEEWASGIGWYGTAHAEALRLAMQAGVTVHVAAGVIAALSPRMRWVDNLQDARKMLVDGDRFYGMMALPSNILKAIRIIDGEDPETVLGGRKVRSFYRNILFPVTSLDVTQDVWFLRHVVPAEWTNGYTQYAHFLGRKGVYDAIAEAIRDLADDFAVLPHQLQAALWVQARGQAT